MAQVHLELLRLSKQGKSLRDLEKRTGIPAAAIVVILKSPLAQAELARGN